MSSLSVQTLRWFLPVILVFATSLLRAETAAANWAMHCQKCHAGDGSGSTLYGSKMNVRDYRLRTVQVSFTDATAFTVLRAGAKDPQGKQLMISFKDRMDDAELAALVQYLRTLQKN